MLLRTRTTNSNWIVHAGACEHRFNSYGGHECIKLIHLINERQYMYIEVSDTIAIIIALTISTTLVITTAIKNAKLMKALRELNVK